VPTTKPSGTPSASATTAPTSAPSDTAIAPTASAPATAAPSSTSVPDVDSGAPPDVDTGTPILEEGGVIVLPDGGTVSYGEPIPDDLDVVTEFDALAGEVQPYFTTDAFEDITPDVANGVASFSIPFDTTTQSFQWNFYLNPQPQDLTGATLVARIRVVSGLTSNPDIPGIVQLFAHDGSSTGYAWTANFTNLIGNDWQEYEFDLDYVNSNSPNYDPSVVNAVALQFLPNQYANGITDADVANAIIEVDWVGIRPAAVVVPDGGTPDGSTPDGSTPDVDSGVPETDSSVPDTDSSVPDTDSSVPETDSSVPETDSSVPETDSSVPETDSGAGSTGEPIPVDLMPVTEFDSPAGYIDAYATHDPFESISPVLANGIGTFSIPFSAVAQGYEWRFDLNPTPQDLTAGTLVARIRLISGFTTNVSIPGILQLYGHNGAPSYGGSASYTNLTGGWTEYEFALNTAGYNSYDPAVVTSVGLAFHPNSYYPNITDADVAPAVIEVDWVGVRLP